MMNQLYQLISTEAGIVSVSECSTRKDGTVEYDYRRRPSRLNILAAIAYKLHQLDSSTLPADFSDKVARLPKNAVSIGEWRFIDSMKFPQRRSEHSTTPVCCIGFDLMQDESDKKLTIGFLLDNAVAGELDDKVFGELDVNPNKPYLFAKIVDMFYQLVNMTISFFTVDSLRYINKFTPEKYKAVVFTFPSLDKYLSDYPFLISLNDTCKYGYPILDQIFKQAQNFIDSPDAPGNRKYSWRAGVPHMFAHIMTKWDLKIRSETRTELTLLAAETDRKYITKLDERTLRKVAEATTQLLETDDQKWMRIVCHTMYISDSSSGGDFWE